MCKWYCLSEGPNCNLKCLHCGTRYCGACLHGEAGKMVSLIKCASCGKKPRTKTFNSSKPNTPPEGRYSLDKKDLVAAMKNIQDEFRPSTSTAGRRSRSSSLSSNAATDPNVFSRLCDTARYPGTHKHRFDVNGRGKGLWGRDYTPKGNPFYGNSTNALEIYHTARYQPKD